MWRNGSRKSGAGGASYVGRTLYLREGGIRCGLFLRLRAALRILPERKHRERNGGKRDHRRTAGGDLLELQEKKANNINLVTAGQFVPQVVRALRRAKDRGLGIPVVYNTSSYENVDTIKRLEGLVDIYLPDLKYVDEKLSAKYSHAPDYFVTAQTAIPGGWCVRPENRNLR